ncbi:MAG: C10 family peptidase [Bacteroidaceae bacterium]|nr:C10 family peptidase [Bacteroidaceae bacterium]
MGIKRVLTVILSVLVSLGINAQKITEQEAKERALKYLENSTVTASGGQLAAPGRDGLVLNAAKVEADGIYAFNMERGGFVIASADSRTLPVLGYSDKVSIDWEKIPDNMRAWLKSYDEAIATLGNYMDFKDGNQLSGIDGDVINTSSRNERDAVEPLIKTRWNQSEPYWNQIPKYNGADKDLLGLNCYTGCVATTMAQIMNYYEWPKEATADIPSYQFTTSKDDYEKIWTIDGLPSVTFDWDNMLDRYEEYDSIDGQTKILGNRAQQKAVATLMRYCAQAVNMNFSPQGSGALSSMIPMSLYSYFGYAPSAYNASRFTYGIDDWEALIYGEVAEGRPVAYGGYSDDDSGHSFICDGYDGNGLFHFNWGWGGYGDGYFSLSVINPTSRAVGYCLGQDAVIGIRTTDNVTQQLPLFQACLSRATQIIDSKTIYFYYSFMSYFYDDVIHDYAMGIIEPDGTLNPYFIGDPSDSIVYSNNWMTVELDPSLMQPGDTLVLYPMVRFRNIPGSDWQMLSSKKHCVYAVCPEDGELCLYTDDAPEMEIKSVDLIFNERNTVEADGLTLTIYNKSDFEYADLIYVRALYYGDVEPDEIENDSLVEKSDYWPGAGFLRAGQNTDVTFRGINLKCEGLVRLKLYSATKDFICSFDIDLSDITGVKVIESNTQNEKYYDLQGHSINALPEQKGLYITRGRKIMVR